MQRNDKRDAPSRASFRKEKWGGEKKGREKRETARVGPDFS
jgi:hypothetical protein